MKDGIKYTGFYLDGNIIRCYEGYDHLYERFVEECKSNNEVRHSLTNKDKENIILQMEDIINHYKEVIEILKR